jgi:hypothetical protein
LLADSFAKKNPTREVKISDLSIYDFIPINYEAILTNDVEIIELT